jgi:hypothetical protein
MLWPEKELKHRSEQYIFKCASHFLHKSVLDGRSGQVFEGSVQFQLILLPDRLAEARLALGASQPIDHKVHSLT